MSSIVRPVDPLSPEWEELSKISHNTSLFVTPDWLSQEKGVMVVGHFAEGKLTTGMVASESLAKGPVAPYQGLLTTNRSNFKTVSQLVEWLEGVGGFPVVWNAPSLIDVRPWYARQGSRWLTQIKYTYYTYSPQVSMEAVEDLYLIPKGRDEIVEMGAPEWFEEMDAITLWGHERVDGKVLWGVDPQNRGYYLHGDGDVIPIVEGLIRMNGSADLSGTEGWKRQFSPKLRTIYGMIRSG